MSTSTKRFVFNLGMPNYKQGHRDWGSVVLSCKKPNSNEHETMASAGCYITSVAIAFDHLSSDIITPLVVRNRLYPTNDCGLNWAVAAQEFGRTFVHSTGGFSSLRRQMFQALQNGIPVISAVPGHMVAVNGFDGVVRVAYTDDGTELVDWTSITPEMFRVNDPGSSNRFTLKQVMDAYNGDLQHMRTVS